MSRYIDADAYERELRTSNIIHHYGEQIVDKIHSTPSIDIVRCGECTHHKLSKIWAETKPCIVEPFPSIRCKILNREVDADDFCSYGERNINEN